MSRFWMRSDLSWPPTMTRRWRCRTDCVDRRSGRRQVHHRSPRERLRRREQLSTACRHVPPPPSRLSGRWQDGGRIEVRFLGMPAGELAAKIQLAADDRSPTLVCSPKTTVASLQRPMSFRLFEHGNAFEQEPNNELAQGDARRACRWPSMASSKRPGTSTASSSRAKKGQVFEVECFARRIRSGLDPVMNLYYADGRDIAGNDDLAGPGQLPPIHRSRGRRVRRAHSPIISAAAARIWFIAWSSSP